MREFEQRRKIKRILYSKLSVGVLCIVALVLIKSAISAYAKYRMSDKAYQETTREYTDLVARKAQLESDIARLGTREGVEADIRTKFGMVKDGEQILILVDRGTTSQPIPSKASAFDALKSLFKR